MTIDSGWTKIIKEAAPHAFTPVIGLRPYTVFIDGQINLMKADYIKTWPMFFEYQFLRKVENAFTHGAKVVVLGFDNYKHVPTAKAMTQLQRCRHVPSMSFTDDEQLPPVLPENWTGAMRNRTFKTKVAAFIAQNLRIKFQNESTRTLVIDFADQVEVLGAPYELPPVLQSSSNAKRGECDIKAFAYLSNQGPLLVESTDGDFIPLALLQMHKEMARSGKMPLVILHRMYTVTDSEKMAKKRNTEGKAVRRYEYVNMAQVLAWLDTELAFIPTPVHAFAALVAATGCDFCMNLPNIGPKTLWKARHMLASLDLRQPHDLMLAIVRIYHNQYKQKVPPMLIKPSPQACLQDIVAQYENLALGIQGNTRIAQRTRESVWTPQRMHAHIGNTLWTLQYWENLDQFLDPLQPGFGYRQEGGRVHFDGVCL
jgi:hypothetical protein|tara:strand:+ start:366 stop:1643 length:1278 start_codon:yes stop_codon:yes gene_type:complete